MRNLMQTEYALTGGDILMSSTKVLKMLDILFTL